VNKKLAIKVDSISKKYTLGKQKESSLRHALTSVFKNKEEKNETFWALKDISFDIEQGDVIGIIGRNGAGKSTLLKILSKITQPTEGRIEINGRVAALLEVGTGFHPELTGRENIYLNGTLLGMTRKEVAEKLDEIIEFSGVIKFIDTPVKHYSSGMYVRLAFSVAAHLEPEILIIDEVLAVGDAEFQKKCLGKMKDVAGEGRTVIFVSHDLAAVKQLCNKGVLLTGGTISEIGSMEKVLKSYTNDFKDEIYYGSVDEIEPKIFKVKIETSEGGGLQSHGQRLKVLIDIHMPIGREGIALSFQIMNSIGNPVTYNWIFDHEKNICRTEGINKFEFIFDEIRLYEGSYFIRVHLSETNNVRQKFDFVDVCNFEVKMLNDKIPEWGWQNQVCQYFDSGTWLYNSEEIKIQNQKVK
jgi:lipopolysaccharide transport system ATP-binding protein